MGKPTRAAADYAESVRTGLSFLLELLACAATAAAATRSPADIAAELKGGELDPDACYRVRDLAFERGGDLKLYLNDGYLIFGKPVAGKRISAIFTADTEGGDAELLVMPPSKGERVSLSAFTGSPTLNEHFMSAMFLFTDDTAEALAAELERKSSPRAPDRGLLLAQEWRPVVSNLSASFSIRLIQHLAAGAPPERGVFYAALQGRQLGNFDVSYDPENQDQIHIGQLKHKDERAYYDTWTHFPARAFRSGARRVAGADLELSNYRIDAVLDASLRLKVVTRATLQVRRGPLEVAGFEITDGMTVKSVTIEGEPAALFTVDALRANLLRRSETILFLVTPARPLEAGRSYEVVFEHAGDVVRPAGRDVFFVSSRSNWYPQSPGVRFSQFDIRFTYPAQLQMVFAGDLKEDRHEGGQRITRRVTGAPIRLAGFNLGRYESVKVSRGPLGVELFGNKQVEYALRPEPMLLPPALPSPFPPRGMGRGVPSSSIPPLPATLPNPTTRLEKMASEIANGFDFLAGFLGPPALPQMMVAPIPGTFGQGFPGLVYLSTMAYLNPGERPVAARNERLQVFFDEILHSHETAHQWWGNVVTTNSVQDDWLLEALANYSALLYIEKRKGAKDMMEIMAQYRTRLLHEENSVIADSAGPIRLGVRLQNSLVPGAWRDIVYGKGSWILHMIRKRVGDAAFTRMLGDICREKRYQTLTVAEFQAYAAKNMPAAAPDRKLEAFFDHWVDNTGIPAFKMTTALKGRAPNVQLTVTVTQSGVDPSATFQVPVEIQPARGKSQTHWITTGEEPAVLRVRLTAPPAKVLLDPNSDVLAVK